MREEIRGMFFGAIFRRELGVALALELLGVTSDPREFTRITGDEYFSKQDQLLESACSSSPRVAVEMVKRGARLDLLPPGGQRVIWPLGHSEIDEPELRLTLLGWAYKTKPREQLEVERLPVKWEKGKLIPAKDDWTHLELDFVGQLVAAGKEAEPALAVILSSPGYDGMVEYRYGWNHARAHASVEFGCKHLGEAKRRLGIGLRHKITFGGFVEVIGAGWAEELRRRVEAGGGPSRPPMPERGEINAKARAARERYERVAKPAWKLMEAIRSGKEVLRAQLECDPSAFHFPMEREECLVRVWSPLEAAIYATRSKLVQWMIEAGARVDPKYLNALVRCDIKGGLNGSLLKALYEAGNWYPCGQYDEQLFGIAPGAESCLKEALSRGRDSEEFIDRAKEVMCKEWRKRTTVRDEEGGALTGQQMEEMLKRADWLWPGGRWRSEGHRLLLDIVVAYSRSNRWFARMKEDERARVKRFWAEVAVEAVEAPPQIPEVELDFLERGWESSLKKQRLIGMLLASLPEALHPRLVKIITERWGDALRGGIGTALLGGIDTQMGRNIYDLRFGVDRATWCVRGGQEKYRARLVKLVSEGWRSALRTLSRVPGYGEWVQAEDPDCEDPDCEDPDCEDHNPKPFGARTLEEHLRQRLEHLGFEDEEKAAREIMSEVRWTEEREAWVVAVVRGVFGRGA